MQILDLFESRLSSVDGMKVSEQEIKSLNKNTKVCLIDSTAQIHQRLDVSSRSKLRLQKSDAIVHKIYINNSAPIITYSEKPNQWCTYHVLSKDDIEVVTVEQYMVDKNEYRTGKKNSTQYILSRFIYVFKKNDKTRNAVKRQHETLHRDNSSSRHVLQRRLSI